MDVIRSYWKETVRDVRGGIDSPRLLALAGVVAFVASVIQQIAS